MPREAKKHEKEEISRSTLSTSISALDSLVVEVLELRPLYNNFVRLALVVFCPLASLTGLVSSSFFQPFFLVTVRPTVAQSQRSCSTLNLWVSPDFRLFGLFEDENGQEFFALT